MSSPQDSVRSDPSTTNIPGQYGPHHQQPYGPPGGYQPPVKKRSKAPLVLGILALVFVLFVGGCVALVVAASSGVDGAIKSGASSANGVPAAAGAGLGTPVRDGKFEFTVTKVEVGPARIGSDVLGQTAQGQFILLHVTVGNIGDVAQLFSDSSQKLYDAQGRQFSSDTTAAIYLDDSQSFLKEINPGNQVNGIVVFDVPKDAKAVRVELHDSPFSGGVSVTLG